MVVPEVIVEQCRGSIERPTADSFSREQDIPDWFQPFTEWLVEGDSRSSDSAGETIHETLPPHFPARPSNKSGGEHTIYSIVFRRTSVVIQWITKSSQRRDRTAITHRYAVVVQDLAAQWIQVIRAKTRQHQIRWQVCSDSFFQKASLDLTTLIIRYSSQKLTKICCGTMTHLPTSIRHEWNRQQSGQRSKRRDFDSVSPIRIRWTMVEKRWNGYVPSIQDWWAYGKTLSNEAVTLHSVVQ